MTPHRPSHAIFTALAVAGGAMSAAAGCNGVPARAGLEGSCSINSDCNAPLICAFGRCHQQCGSVDASNRDCPAGERCVSAGASNVCELSSEAACGLTSLCVTGLVCEPDLQCHSPCSATQLCPGSQTCVGGGCYYASEVVDASSSEGGTGEDATTLLDGRPIDDAPIDTPWEASAEAGPLGFTPSNFQVTLSLDGGAPGDAAADADASGPPDSRVSASCTDCLPVTSMTILMNDGTSADLYVVRSLYVDATAALRLSGTRPIILVALATVDIEGQLLVNATAGAPCCNFPGPGGFGGMAPGPGAGQNGSNAAYPMSGGGGGSYCGVGGHGGVTTGTPAAPGGRTYGSPGLVPLLGGSAGGGYPNGAGGGGGAIQIVAGAGIVVGEVGAINAGGAGSGSPSIGGGSGGAILLEAPSVVLRGVLAANGGAGGGGPGAQAGDGLPSDQPALGYLGVNGNGSAGSSVGGSDGYSTTAANYGAGGGGAGRIRINTASGNATLASTAIVSPSLRGQGDGGTPCATQGTLAP